MSDIRVVWGTGTGPTPMASYDAALAGAGVENYNLVAVSSMIPAGASVEAVGTAPDLGPIGDRLTVVEGRATTAGPGRVSAALGWTQRPGDGPGLFYEAAGETDPDEVERRVREGLDAGLELRDWETTDTQVVSDTSRAEPGTYTTAIVLAVYGTSESILD